MKKAPEEVTYEKSRTFRDRKSHERKTLEALEDKDRAHPVHVPYKREAVNWKHNLLLEDDV